MVNLLHMKPHTLQQLINLFSNVQHICQPAMNSA